MAYWTKLWEAMIGKGYSQIESKPEKVNHGADWASGAYGLKNPYNSTDALSAYGVHGYTHAAAVRSSQDLAALPLVLYRGKGKNKEVVIDHPVIDLLDQPNTTSDGFLWREQCVIDLMLCGNNFNLLLGPTDVPLSVVRLHPGEVEIVTDQNGIKGYNHSSGGSVVMYPPDRIIHIRNATFHQGALSLFGCGAIQALQLEIDADINAQRLCSQSSKQGRPDVILSPKDESDVWSSEMRRAIASKYKGLISNGGALVLSGAVDLKTLNLTPREMEFSAVRKTTRESISAVLGVPGSVLGLPSANYATSKEQSIHYWSVQQKRGTRIGSLFTQIAQRFDSDLYVEHDYSRVETLQAMKTEQLKRVEMHIYNGIAPSTAYDMEGLTYPKTETTIEDEDKIENQFQIQDSRRDTLLRLFDESHQITTPEKIRLVEKQDPITPERTVLISSDQGAEKKILKSAIWNHWVRAVHNPAEKALFRASRKYLKGAIKRYRRRIEEQVTAMKSAPSGIVHRSVLDWSSLLAFTEERQEIIRSLGPDYMFHWELSATSSMKEIYRIADRPIPQTGFGGRKLAESHLSENAAQIANTTGKSVQSIIEQGLVNGLSVREMADQMSASAVFDRYRATMIARTESTRLINTATNQAYIEAMADGINLMKEWLSSEDNDVRPAHIELNDSDPIGPNELFEVDNQTAPSPGNFGSAALDINCRCTIIPVVLD